MTNQNLTEIVAIVDRSSSMAPLQVETILGFNTFLADQKKQPGEAVFTLATFSDDYRLVYDAVPLKSVPDLNKSTYNPGGWTALLDAVGNTCNAVGARLASTKEEDRPSKVLVLIMTDGEENRSRTFTHENIRDIISHQRDKYSWEFVFIGANQDAITAGAAIGVDANHSYNFVATAAGSASLFSSISGGTSDYRSSLCGASYNMADPTAGLQGAQAAQTQNPYGVVVGGLQGDLNNLFGQGTILVDPYGVVQQQVSTPVTPVTPTDPPKSDK